MRPTDCRRLAALSREMNLQTCSSGPHICDQDDRNNLLLKKSTNCYTLNKHLPNTHRLLPPLPAPPPPPPPGIQMLDLQQLNVFVTMEPRKKHLLAHHIPYRGPMESVLCLHPLSKICTFQKVNQANLNQCGICTLNVSFLRQTSISPTYRVFLGLHSIKFKALVLYICVALQLLAAQ